MLAARASRVADNFLQVHLLTQPFSTCALSARSGQDATVDWNNRIWYLLDTLCMGQSWSNKSDRLKRKNLHNAKTNCSTHISEWLKLGLMLYYLLKYIAMRTKSQMVLAENITTYLFMHIFIIYKINVCISFILFLFPTKGNFFELNDFCSLLVICDGFHN